MTSLIPARRALAAVSLALVSASCGPAKPAAEAAPAPEAPQQSAAAPSAAAQPAAPPSSSLDDLLSATVIRWSAVGDFTGDVQILDAGTTGSAPVTDHVEFAYDFTLEGNTGLVGTPTFTNFPSTMGALRNGAEGCRAPTVSGSPYEHWTIENIENGLGGAIALTIRTDYPEGQVPVACTGGDQPSPARTVTSHVEIPIPSVALLMMGDQLTGDAVQLSHDKRSIITKDRGWTYTYTPSRVR